MEEHKNMKNGKSTLGPGYGKQTEKLGKWEMETLRPGIWQDILKNIENEKCTL